MKITQLDIEGFRSLKKVSWKPGDLNVIIGPNGSGKSNLLRILELISVAAQGRLSKQIQSEGGMGAIVWDGRTENISLRLTTSSVHQEHNSPGLADSISLPQINFYLLLSRLGTSSAYRVQREDLGSLDGSSPFLERQGLTSTIYIDSIPMTVHLENVSEEESTLSLVSGPFFKTSEITYFRSQLLAWTIYQDVSVNKSADVRRAVISKREDVVSSDGQNLVSVLHTHYMGNRDFKQQINTAMSAAFGEDFDELIFPPDADQRIQLKARWKTLQREQSTADLSDGTLRFLFLLAVLANPTPAPLIAIDEPETGLHPSMLPIIAEFAVEASTRTQIVFTTHSDQFLDAFRVTDTRPTTTVAKWQDGETTLTTLDDEQLAYWLEDYTLGNLFRAGQLENMAS